MKTLIKKTSVLLGCIALSLSCTHPDPTGYVVTMMGTGGAGGIVPNAAVPFGMVQLAPDTDAGGTGYFYGRNSLMGFSHMHKSGSGGGSDFQDILFLPVTGDAWDAPDTLQNQYRTPFSHEDELSSPGYYSVLLPEFGIRAELAATSRCGMHRYTYPKGADNRLLIDLKHGNPYNCTIIPEDCIDTVKVAFMERVDERTVRGYRISNGWCPEMHVCFEARFSRPIRDFRLYDSRRYVGGDSLEGRDVRALLSFDGSNAPLEVSVGISPVDMEGAGRNRSREIGRKTFDRVAAASHEAWRKELSALEVSDPDTEQGRMLYTCYYFSLLYPMLYSDVDGRYRSSDAKVYPGGFGYYAGVLGFWDIFRAHLPLITVVHPEVMTDLMKTMLSHYDHCGQLPIWTLAGQETCCMEGYPAAPVVSDAYSKGIRGFDAEKMLDALDVSASRDTFGFFCRAYRGATNYRKYHYVPNDLEISSVSKTLEYSYDDWCISKFAGMLGRQDLEKAYLERSGWYRNVFDPGRMLMRGRDSKGDWREPFDPFYSNHLRSDDDFMEGTAWHWTFHVPHDPEGLMELLGGRQAFAEKLDSLFFILGPEIHGPNPSGDMTGMIGHYAQGNEPGHHTIFFYNLVGQPWKTQKLVTEVMHTLYNTTPEGICGNDDTGQMSAWCVWNAMGLYPMTHGDAEYMIGSPQHERLVFHHANGTLTVEAPGVSPENCYIRRITLNGKPLEGYKVRHEALFGGDAHLHFEMSSTPRED